MVKKRKSFLNPEDLASLVKLASYPETEVLWKLMKNRIEKDKNSILAYPESDPQRLAVSKAFFRGRISGLLLLRRDVLGAAAELDKLEEEEDKKVKKKK